VGGLSCDYQDLKGLNIPIVADSAESLGSTYRGDLVGTQADIHCFSLHRAKIISSGEGGFITTNSDEFNELARSFVNHGYAKDKKSYEYVHDNFGLNFRMTDVCAAIGRVQLRKLHKYVSHRNHIAKIYKKELHNLVEIQQYNDRNFLNNYFFFGILHKERDRVLRHLYDSGVEAKTWTAVHQQPIWPALGLKNAEEISNQVILLPIHNCIKEEEVEYVLKRVKEVV